MKSMVVFFALAAVACGSYIPVAQPPHHPAIVLDPHGRPLDTAEVINARAVHLQAKALDGHYAPLAHSAIVAPAVHSVVSPLAHSVVAPGVYGQPAVSHTSRLDVRTSHGLASPLLAHSGLGLGLGGHYLHKRSLGHLSYAAPVIAPSAVSHQSRVDVISSPAVVSHAVHAPVVSHAVHAPVVSHAVHAPVVAVAPSAVSHQSRVDVRTSPAVVSTSVLAPVSHGVVAPYASAAYGQSLYSAPLEHSGLLHSAPLAHGW